MFQLRPYQELLIEGVRDEFRSGRRRTCIVAPCGAGKTVIMAWMAAQTATRGQSVLFAVHRQELIDQSSQTFNPLGVQHGIIAPGCPATGDQIQIGSIFTIARRLDKIQPPSVIIFDECFVAGTIVGDKPIEQLEIRDIVPCFDEKTNQIKYSKITHIFKRPAPPTLLRIIVQGKTIVCTLDHPIFTPRGWKSAKDIEEGDLVYVCMSALRRTNAEQESPKMSDMLSKRDGRAQSLRSTRANESKKPNGKSCEQKEDGKYPQENRAQTTGKRRQWNREYSSSGNISGCSGMDTFGIHFPYRNTALSRVSNALQNRYSKPGVKDSYRSGRIFSCCTNQEKTGRKENKFLEVARVDSVEIFQRGSSNEFTRMCPDGYVYNIEVEKYNTYFANGLAVHNCHHATAGTWRKLMKAFPKAYIIGLTATPARLDGSGLGEIFESLVLGPSVKQLIEWGNLAPFQYYAPPVKADLSGLRVKYGDYVKGEIALRMDRSEIIGDAIEQYRRLANGKRAIAYCVSRVHSEHTAEMFRAAGIPAVHIDGETDHAVRKAAIEQFRTGQIKVLCNVDLISEGFDVPAMEAVLLLRPTQSLTLHIQQSMRPMRPDSDNPDKVAIIIDHVGNCYRHGLPDEDRTWSLEGKKKNSTGPREVSLRQCPKCYAAHRPVPTCPLCGYQYAPAERAEPERLKGELVKIDELERKLRKQEIGRAKNITDLEQIALKRGYKLGWIKHAAKWKGIPMNGGTKCRD